jgi:hypothetical protein
MNANPDDLSSHPDLGPIGARMRSTWAQEQDDATADAREQFQRHQSFRDWLTAAMHAGDRLAITVVDQRFTGTVEEIGDDLIGLRAMFGRVDIHVLPGIPLQIELEDHPKSGGQRGNTDVSFSAALAARDPEADTSIGTSYHPQGIDGVMTAGTDFVISKAKAGAVTVLPMAQIAWVANRRT